MEFRYNQRVGGGFEALRADNTSKSRPIAIMLAALLLENLWPLYRNLSWKLNERFRTGRYLSCCRVWNSLSPLRPSRLPVPSSSWRA